MAERKAKEIKAILREIEKLDATTLRVAQNVIRLVGTDDLDRLRDELTKHLLPVARVGASSAAELGAATYNRWRAQDLGEKTKAVVASAYDEGKYMSAINAAVKKAELGGTMGEILATLSGRIGYTSRTSYSRSLFQSGKADSQKPQYARVPEDEEACQFCMMLASRGFEYSKGSLGDDVHNHANCRCTYVCSWDADPRAQGYSDKEWYDRWQESIDQEAEERAERNDTTVEEERKAIMQRYSDQATRSKKAAAMSEAGERNAARVEPYSANGGSTGEEMLLRTPRDPAADYYGPALKNNEAELDAIFEDLERSGVEINIRDTENLGYGPSSTPGEPGSMSVWDGASISAFMHEYDHFKFDRELGYPGSVAIFSNHDLVYEFEKRAYDVEINLAKSNGLTELCDILTSLRDEVLKNIETGGGCFE